VSKVVDITLLYLFQQLNLLVFESLMMSLNRTHREVYKICGGLKEVNKEREREWGRGQNPSLYRPLPGDPSSERVYIYKAIGSCRL